ncbi:hypothetical protein D9758_013360 [Tetrapyrgos nigripes]|uniref:DUF6534 domain-containing protein n=1 Tax=Tetrapyrgos nigripes TaxID=182062 RepID=A0A8H5CJT5_9AGAR|nr:hypothetical protein D9758_013360 [Tetrapyrgos nigripes]
MRVDAGHDLPLFVTFTIKQEKLMLAFYGISPAVDLVIAATMWYYLSKRQEETHFAKTASLLHRLTILSINSGLWTALFACATLILVLATPVTNLYSIFAFPIGALYVNSLLLNLITRRYLTNSSSQASSSGGNVLQLTPMNRSEIVNVSNSSRFPSRRHNPYISDKVSITREEHKHSDAFATELGQLGQPHIGGEALSASDWK